MIGIVTVFDENDVMIDMLQIEISNNNNKKYNDLMMEIHKSEPEIYKHIELELMKKFPKEIYWICNIFSDMMNYLYCLDNDV